MKKIVWLAMLPLFGFGAKIELYHAFQGFLDDTFSQVIREFEEQSGHAVALRQFDNSNRAIEEALEQKPHLMFGYEVAAASLIHDARLIPVQELGVEKSRYIDSIAQFYSNSRGELAGMPFNISTGVMFFNKAAFKKAHLDPEHPPTTWPEMEKALEKLQSAGLGGFSTAWPAAYHVEHIAALHAAPLGTNQNGFMGPCKLTLSHPSIRFHLEKVLEWSQKGLFTYAGQYSDAERHFAQGKVSILLQGANRYALIKRGADFEIGAATLPYWPQFSQEPHTLNTGGAALWAFRGHEADREAVVALLAFLSQDKIAGRWHEMTGYLPVTKAAAGYLTTSDNPAARHAVSQVFERKTSPYSVGLRFSNYIPVRQYLMDNLEKMFEGKLSAKEVLSDTEDFAALKSKL